MELGRNGGVGSSSSYLDVEETGSTVSSSRSGTIVSTAYTSNVSRPSTISVEAAMHFLSLGIHEEFNGNDVKVCCEEAEEEEEKEERIRSLVQEFFSAPSANCSLEIGDISVIERWLKELGVDWVLRLNDDGASVSVWEKLLHRDARSWIRALGHVVQTFCLMRPLFTDRDSVDLPSICQRVGQHVGGRCIPDRYHLALFILETISKILSFVDVLVAWDPDMSQEVVYLDRVLLPPYSKLFNQLGVHDALSEASYKIMQIVVSTSVEDTTRIETKMDFLVSEYKWKLRKTIKSTIDKITTMLMEDGDDSSGPLNSQGSSDIHKVTQSVMTYIWVLWANYSSVDAAMPSMFACHSESERPFHNMIMEMMSCLQEKLANISESFPDQGLRFLFLLNNSYFIQNSQYSCLQRPLLPINLNEKIETYMDTYVQVSWAPLLSCLFNPTPLCLGKKYSPLSKFEAEFEKYYTTQKQWKIPDPKLRRQLREAITDRIIPGYTEYLEDNKVTDPKISPQELEAMLQELFEG